jgi:hypothetical protein
LLTLKLVDSRIFLAGSSEYSLVFSSGGNRNKSRPTAITAAIKSPCIPWLRTWKKRAAGLADGGDDRGAVGARQVDDRDVHAGDDLREARALRLRPDVAPRQGVVHRRREEVLRHAWSPRCRAPMEVVSLACVHAHSQEERQPCAVRLQSSMALREAVVTRSL